MGYDYDNWQSKWYSPVCRDWFKQQNDNPDHTIVTDLYTFTDGFEGITLCAPVLNHLSTDDKFFGAMCIDLMPKGQIHQYFEFRESDHEQYVMFQENPKETQEELVKAIGSLLLEQSEFLKDYEIEDHHMTTMPAGFYDDVILFPRHWD